MFEVTRTIYSDNERSEQFFGNRILFKLVPGGVSYLINETIRIQIGKNHWD